MASAVSGVSDAGLSTTVQPAARAGRSWWPSRSKFHGVTRAPTPTGRWVTSVRVPPAGEGP